MNNIPQIPKIKSFDLEGFMLFLRLTNSIKATAQSLTNRAELTKADLEIITTNKGE